MSKELTNSESASSVISKPNFLVAKDDLIDRATPEDRQRRIAVGLKGHDGMFDREEKV